MVKEGSGEAEEAWKHHRKTAGCFKGTVGSYPAGYLWGLGCIVMSLVAL